jgi:hypothetical protein
MRIRFLKPHAESKDPCTPSPFQRNLREFYPGTCRLDFAHARNAAHAAPQLWL